MALEPVDRQPPRRRHDAGVVDQQIEAILLAGEPLRERAHRGQVGEVERLDAARHRRSANVDRASVPLSVSRHGEHDRAAVARELARGHQSEAAVGAGDDGGAPALVRDVGGGPAGHQLEPSCVARTQSMRSGETAAPGRRSTRFRRCTRVGSKTSTSSPCSRSVSGPVIFSVPTVTRRRSRGQAALGSSTGSPGSAIWTSSANATGAAAESRPDLVLEVVAAARARGPRREPAAGRRRPKRVAHEPLAAVAIDPLEGVQRVVRDRRVARRRGQRRRDGGRTRAPRGGAARNAGNFHAAATPRALRLDELDEPLGGAGGKARRGDGDDVGPRPVGQVELDRQAARIGRPVGVVRVARPVREPDRDRDLRALHVRARGSIRRPRRSASKTPAQTTPLACSAR